MIPLLETDRLVLRPLSMDDAGDLLAVFSDAETMRFWVARPHTSAEQTREQIGDLLSYPNARQWAITLKGQSAAVGVIGYLGNEGVPGIGYILRRDLWRQGYMAEALRAVLDYGFGTLGYDRAELWIHEHNVASQQLARKLGFAVRSQFHMKWPQFDQPHIMRVFGLLAADFGPATYAAPGAVSFNRVVPILVTPDVKATAEFYRDKLGFTVEFMFGEPPSYAGLWRGDWTFPAARIHLTQGTGAADGVQLFIFVGPGIDRLHDELLAAGVNIVNAPDNKPWGQREFLARDCDGRLLRFAMAK